VTLSHVIISGRTIKLGRLIGKGGEGEVYAIADDPNHAIKIYTTADRLTREDKIAAMVSGDLAKRSPLAAFPVAVAHLKDGSFGGFVMRLMSGHKPLHELYAPGPRKHNFPQADYRFLARAATNIARAFASIHAASCVVGDINHSGILVSTQATAALIDADSFQFSDGKERYLCRVGVPEYTPPELQGKSLQGVVRTTDHDAFGLAVVLFQVLLMGRHPFVGTVRKGEIPPLHENVQNFRYAYTDVRDVGMDQPPGTPALADFAPDLASLFDRAFAKGFVGNRPSASDWVRALDRFESTLSQCPDNPLHFGPKDASDCAWCEMERQLGTFLFLPYLPSGPSAPKVDPGQSFNIEIVWARIERVKVLSPDQLNPRIPRTSNPAATEAARKAKVVNPSSRFPWEGAGFIVAGIGLLVLAPKAWFIALVLGWFGMSALKSKPAAAKVDAAPFRNAFVDAQTQWFREVENWRRRVGHTELFTLKEQLKAARSSHLEAKDEERRLTEEYKARRREIQLNSYLDGFDLSTAGLKGIGQAKLSTLSSYGIDTAADISKARLQTVPGFGEALTARLIEWRDQKAARFVYNTAPNDSDRRESARISALVDAKLSQLRITLNAGALDLEVRARRVQEFAEREDAALIKLHQRVAQARADLEYLNEPIPFVSPPQTNGQFTPSSSRSSPLTQTAPPSPQPPTRSPSSGTTPSCPRCGSLMRQRLARRGRNAGSYFWGCSRYPSCKGTRHV
jgi:DNA-binding helix-hairpin-helix protein with protein kinase domain